MFPWDFNCKLNHTLFPLRLLRLPSPSTTLRARLWGTAEREKQTSACSSPESFTGELCKVFGSELGDHDTAQLVEHGMSDSGSFSSETVAPEHHVSLPRVRGETSWWKPSGSCRSTSSSSSPSWWWSSLLCQSPATLSSPKKGVSGGLGTVWADNTACRGACLSTSHILCQIICCLMLGFPALIPRLIFRSPQDRAGTSTVLPLFY